LGSNISDYELGLTKFIVFIADRVVNPNLSRGGGVLLAVNSNLNCTRIPVKNVPCIEQVFVSLKFNDSLLLLGCVYIPPNTHSDTYYEHCEVVENIIANHSFDNILIIGDFNLPGFSLGVNNLINNPSTNTIINSYINYLGLGQFNNISNYRNNNILDLIFSDTHLDTIFHGCSLIPLFDSYHPPLEFLYPLNLANTLKDQSNPIVYNFNACNFNEITRFLANIDMIPNLTNLHLDVYSVQNETGPRRPSCAHGRGLHYIS